MTITLCKHTRFAARDSRRARRDHHLDLIAVRGDCLVGGRTIIGSRTLMLLFLCNVVEAQAADLSGPETAEPSNSRVSIGEQV